MLSARKEIQIKIENLLAWKKCLKLIFSILGICLKYFFFEKYTIFISIFTKILLQNKKMLNRHIQI